MSLGLHIFGRSQRAPAWFAAAIQQGARPFAEGEHGMWSVISVDGRRVITDADAPRGSLYAVTGRTTRRDGFVEDRGEVKLPTAKAIDWVLRRTR